jgi:hypothetical protein
VHAVLEDRAVLDQFDLLVVHEARAVHRLHDAAYRLAVYRHPPAPGRRGRRGPRARGSARLALPRSRSSTHRPACGSNPTQRAAHQLPSFRGRRAGSARPTAQREPRAVLRISLARPRGCYRARLTQSFRSGGPTSRRGTLCDQSALRATEPPVARAVTARGAASDCRSAAGERP